MLTENELIKKLLKVEALCLGAATDGEKNAALNARERLQKKLDEYQRKEEVMRWTFRTKSRFEKRLLQALLKRYGLKPYRYKRQRETTIMANTTQSVCDIMWFEYQQMRRILANHLDEITDKIIKTAINDDNSPDVIKEPHQIN